MIEETIRTVKESETQAEQVIAQAKADAEQLIKEAESKTGEMIAAAREDARNALRDAETVAKARAEIVFAETDRIAAEEGKKLKAAAKSREAEVVAGIMKTLLTQQNTR